uniref:Protein saal1 n=1 Tax=Cucumis melo TaxID=3656 RepID=A0A9I9DQ55_CUCME
MVECRKTRVAEEISVFTNKTFPGSKILEGTRVGSDSDPIEAELEADVEPVEDCNGPAHHPSAPLDELFDISTTVDPSYIISLIRKLLPLNASNTRNSCENGHDGGDTSVNKMDEGDGYLSGDQLLSSSGTVSKCLGLEIADGSGKLADKEGEDEGACLKSEQLISSPEEKVWEEYGCILWDLSASRSQAELMVQNLVLEVLSANLMVSQSVRVMKLHRCLLYEMDKLWLWQFEGITYLSSIASNPHSIKYLLQEISLGIIGNLACHEVPMKHIVAKSGLITTIVSQLFLDDAQCLCEVCRLLNTGLQSSECVIWAEALNFEHVLSRILWVSENTLNPQLIEKSVGLLSTIIESHQEVVHALLPCLMKLGLSSVLFNLFSFEMKILTNERSAERHSILDVILRAVETLSGIEEHSHELCSNKELFQLVRDLVKLPDAFEVSSSCISAVVLIANILSDVPDLAFEMSQDLSFLQGLFDTFSFAGDDLEARDAVWSIIARILVRVQENVMSRPKLLEYVSLLVSKTDLIEDDLLDHCMTESNKEEDGMTSACTKSNSRCISLRRIISILNHWTASKDEGTDVRDEYCVEDVDVNRLLTCCSKHSEELAETGTHTS